jgi:hypothetical protein
VPDLSSVPESECPSTIVNVCQTVVRRGVDVCVGRYTESYFLVDDTNVIHNNVVVVHNEQTGRCVWWTPIPKLGLSTRDGNNGQ